MKTFLRSAAVLGFLGLAGFWIWAFSPLPERGHPDNLDIPEFSEPAEQLCLDARAGLDDVWKNVTTPDEVGPPEQFAIQIGAATEILVLMVTELRNLSPLVLDQEDRRIVNLWLNDWEVYLADRRRLEAKLLQGEEAGFTYTARDGVRIADIVDRFAEVNSMANCATPKDI